VGGGRCAWLTGVRADMCQRLRYRLVAFKCVEVCARARVYEHTHVRAHVCKHVRVSVPCARPHAERRG